MDREIPPNPLWGCQTCHAMYRLKQYPSALDPSLTRAARMEAVLEGMVCFGIMCGGMLAGLSTIQGIFIIGPALAIAVTIAAFSIGICILLVRDYPRIDYPRILKRRIAEAYPPLRTTHTHDPL